MEPSKSCIVAGNEEAWTWQNPKWTSFLNAGIGQTKCLCTCLKQNNLFLDCRWKFDGCFACTNIAFYFVMRFFNKYSSLPWTQYGGSGNFIFTISNKCHQIGSLFCFCFASQSLRRHLIYFQWPFLQLKKWCLYF